jgi:hypothetical protein
LKLRAKAWELCTYELVSKVGKEVSDLKLDDYPPKIQHLLWNFKELVGDDITARFATHEKRSACY